MITRREFWTVFTLRFLGYFLILSFFAGLVLTLLPFLASEATYRIDNLAGRQFTLEEDLPAEPLRMATVEAKPVPLPPLVGITPVDRQFSIVIPKINANSPVVVNVDAGDQTAYTKALKSGVAHAAGTALPGQKGNIFLFAHSSVNFWEVGQFNPDFFLLRELEPEDEINLFYNDRRYLYAVEEKKITEPGEVEYLNNQQLDYQRLTLQTCWPPGTAIKRLLVLARLVQAEASSAD